MSAIPGFCATCGLRLHPGTECEPPPPRTFNPKFQDEVHVFDGEKIESERYRKEVVKYLKLQCKLAGFVRPTILEEEYTPGVNFIVVVRGHRKAATDKVVKSDWRQTPDGWEYIGA